MADHPTIYQLVARSTLTKIGAGARMGGANQFADWPINPPPWRAQAIDCRLTLRLNEHGTYSVTLWRSELAQIIRRDCVQDLDVDAVVQELWTTGSTGKGGSDVAAD